MFDLALRQSLRREHPSRDHSVEVSLLGHLLRARHISLRKTKKLIVLVRKQDACEGNHALRVRRYALRLAEALGLDPWQRQQLSLAARLHDVGKIRIPLIILRKPRSLSAEERRVVEEHAVFGETLLASLVPSRTVLAAVRGHHERFDGAGYPDRLQGKQIPPLARIISIADCFDTLTSRRPYREALSRTEALEVLREGAGSQFDPEFVEVFTEVTGPRLKGVWTGTVRQGSDDAGFAHRSGGCP